MKALDLKFFRIIVKNDPFPFVFMIVTDKDNGRFSKISSVCTMVSSVQTDRRILILTKKVFPYRCLHHNHDSYGYI